MTMQDKIRPGYKQTEVGVIPEDWDCLQLGEIAGTITTGKLDANAMSKEGDYPFFTCAREIYRIDKFAFDADALLVSGNGANVGYVHHYIGKFNAYQRTYVLKDFSAETVYLRLQLERGIQARIRTEVNAGNTPYILMGTLSGMNIPLPPTAEEQRAIAEALGDADALIAALEAMIAKKRDLKQAAMQQILTGKTRLPGFGPTIAKYKKSEVGAIPEDWNLAKLGEVCSFENGDRGVNYPSGNDFVANGVPFVNAGHLGAGNIKTDQLDYITRAKFDILGNGKFRPGDILFCLRGSLGKFAMVDNSLREGAIASSLIIIRPRQTSMTVAYFISYLSSRICSDMIDLWAGGAAQPNLGGRELARFSIPTPPNTQEQTAIAEVLSDMDADLAALEARAAKARAVKQGMMQESLTGKVRLL